MAISAAQAGLQLPAVKIIEAWDRVNDDRGMEALLRHLVGQIRLWRPEVVVTHDAGLDADDPLLRLVHQAVLAAIRQAGDATALPDQITDAGLALGRRKKSMEPRRPDPAGQTSWSLPSSCRAWAARWPMPRPSRAASCRTASRSGRPDWRFDL